MKKRLLSLIAAGALAVGLACPASAAGFLDMNGHWAASYAEDLAARKIVMGKAGNLFDPNGEVTAAEALAFCSRLLQLDNAAKQAIQDRRGAEVKALLPEACGWAAPETAICLEAGIITRAELEQLCETGGIQKPMAKEDMSMLIVRAMRLEDEAKGLDDLTLTYTDGSEVAEDRLCYVCLLSSLDVVSGTDANEFEPQSPVNRAVMAVMLSRALEKMEDLRIVVDLPAYSTYAWTGGRIVSAASNSAGGITLALTSPVSGERILAMSPNVPIYRSGMGGTLADLTPGTYAKVVLNAKGEPSAVHLSGELVQYTGTVVTASQEELVLQDSEGGAYSFALDRCTQVQAGPGTGDPSLIEPAGGYREASVWVDGMGHTAAVSLTGGIRRIEGIISGVSAAGTAVDVAGFTGAVKTYQLTPGASVSINGLAGTLGTGYTGYYASILLDNDTNQVSALEVDTAVTYLQGTIRSISSRTITVLPFDSSKSEAYLLAEDAEVSYEGEAVSLQSLVSGQSVTIRLNREKLVDLVSAWPGERVTQGEITSMEFGVTTVMTVGLEDGTQTVFRLDTGDPPPMTRNGNTCTIDKLMAGDRVAVTVRRSAVTKIDATSQEATHTGTIVGVNTGLDGTTLVVKLADGETVTYPVEARAAVTQGDKTVGLSALRPGLQAELVVSGGRIVSVNLPASLPSSQQRSGMVISLDASKGTMLVKEGDGALLSVSVPSSARVIDASGKTVYLRNLDVGAQVQLYGSVGNDGVFVATLVIRVG